MKMADGMRSRHALDKMPTGIQAFDEISGGGVPRGRATLVAGGPGTGKTIFALQSLVNGATVGHRHDFMQFMVDCVVLLTHGIANRVSLRELRIVKYRGSPFGANAWSVTMGPSGMEVAGGHLTALGVAQRLIRLTKQAGITTICTSLVQDSEAQAETTSLHFISTIADTWIHLSYLVKAGERNRALTIVKSRGTNHSNQVRELVLSDEGVDLAEVYTAWGEVLMGTARWQKESEEETEQARIRNEIDRKQRELGMAEAEANARMEAIKRELEYRRSDLESLLKEQQLREERAKTLHQALSHKRGGSDNDSE